MSIKHAMDGDVLVYRTKTRKIKVLPIPKAGIELLKSLPRNLSGFVFMTNGLPVKEAGIKSAWKHAAKKAKINCGLYAAVRHSYATQHLQNGTPLEIIQKLLAHVDAASTMKYAKIPVEYLRQFIDDDKDISSG